MNHPQPRLLAQKQSLGSGVRPVHYEVFVAEAFQQPRLIPKHLTGPTAEDRIQVKEVTLCEVNGNE